MGTEVRAGEDAVREVAARFYDAVNAVLQGDATPMLRLWSVQDDTSYCDTRGQAVRGRDALEAYWREAARLNAEAPSKLSAIGEMQHSVVGGELAYVVASEMVCRDGEPGTVIARATNIFRREAGGWRLLHRHADAPPAVSQVGSKEG